MKKYVIVIILFFFTNINAQENYTGLIFSDTEDYEKIGVASLPFGTGEIPSRIDLSSYMPPVGNQNPQNSCVAWATTYSCLSYYNKEINNESYYSGDVVNYRNILSPSYVYNQINNGQDRGTYFEKAFDILKNEGACTYNSMPYNPNDWVSQPNAIQKEEAKRYKIETFRRLNLTDALTSIKAELLNKNPVIVGVVNDESYFQSGFHYNGTHYVWNTIGELNGSMGHAIIIVGYDDDMNAFKFMNSWGDNWGNRGYGWIHYNIIREVVRRAFIIKPRFRNDVIEDESLPEYITDTSNELKETDINTYGLNFYINNVFFENDITSPQVPSAYRKMQINGNITLPQNIGSRARIVINFYFNNNGIKGAPVLCNDYRFALPNGQAASGTPEFNINNDINCAWWAIMPYRLLRLPRGMVVNTPFGPTYQVSTSYLIAEPVLFVDNFPIRIGQLIFFTVTL